MSEFDDLFGEWAVRSDGTPKTCTTRPYLGSGSHGDVYGDPIPHEGLVQMPSTRLVRGSGGDLVSSSTVIYVEDLSLADQFALGSLVTPDTGHEAPVVAVAVSDVDGLFRFVAVTLG